MARFDPDPFVFLALKEKVVVLTGGANGIGAAVVSLLFESKARIVFGDRDTVAGKKLEASYPDRVNFVLTNAAVYSSILNLFQVAYGIYGRVDHAFAVAGISELGSWFHTGLDLSSIEAPPELLTLNVDLLGVLYFSRIAAVYLRKSATEHPESENTLVLVSSVAGILESPGLPVYGAAKHGVIGLMRSLRCSLPASHKISISVVCPWMTSTAMTKDIEIPWQKEGLPVSQPQDVAQIIVGLAAVGEEGNGKSVYVEGGRGWDVEEGLEATREAWMGIAQSRAWLQGERFMRFNRDSAAYWATKNGDGEQSKTLTKS